MLILFLAAQAALPDAVSRSDRCAALAASDPARALDEAGAWQVAGGGAMARACAGLAYARQARWPAAAAAFEAAAREGERRSDGRTAAYWVQAGNAALAGGDPGKARAHLDAAIARGQLTGTDAGEAHLDRARARAALGDLNGARGDLDRAIAFVPDDPLAWLLSATLARRQGNLALAATHIEEAARRSPDDAQVALEAGNIAMLSGNETAARTAWQAAVANGPASVAGEQAATALKQLDQPREIR